MKYFEYRGYTIEFAPKPVASRAMDWQWTFNGWEYGDDFDERVGFAGSMAAAMAAVDFDILQNRT